MRLHAERATLKLVLSALRLGTIEYNARTPHGDNLEAYLRDSSRLLNRDRYFKVHTEQVVDDLDACDPIVQTEDEPLLLKCLSSARRQIRGNIKAICDRNRAEWNTLDGIVIVNGVQTIVDNSMNTKISFGDGNVFHGDVISAGIIQSSFNRARESSTIPELKTALEKLTADVAKLCEKLGSDQAEATARHLRAFVDEATAKKPQRSLLTVTSEGLIEASKAVSALAEPIVQTTKQILSLLSIGDSH